MMASIFTVRDEMTQRQNGAATALFDYAGFSKVLEAQFRADPVPVLEGLETRVLNSPPRSEMEAFAWAKWLHFNEKMPVTNPDHAAPANIRHASDPHAKCCATDRQVVLFTPGTSAHQTQQTAFAVDNLVRLSHRLPLEKDHISKLAAARWYELWGDLLDNNPKPSVLEPVRAIARNDSWQLSNLRSFAQFMLEIREPGLERDLRETVGDYAAPQPRNWTLQ